MISYLYNMLFDKRGSYQMFTLMYIVCHLNTPGKIEQFSITISILGFGDARVTCRPSIMLEFAFLSNLILSTSILSLFFPFLYAIMELKELSKLLGDFLILILRHFMLFVYFI